MLNQIVIVGRIVQDLEVKELEDGKKVANALIAVPRSFKNAVGEYDTDFIKVTLWQDIASNTAKYCKKGDLVGIKGRLQVDTKLINDMKIYENTVVAEKVTFLSSKHTDDAEESKEE